MTMTNKASALPCVSCSGAGQREERGYGYKKRHPRGRHKHGSPKHAVRPPGGEGEAKAAAAHTLSVVTKISVSSSMPRAASAAVTFPRPSSSAEIMPANVRRWGSVIDLLYGLMYLGAAADTLDRVY